jgi:hypothetical protein
MAKLETFIKAVRHDFTRDERDKISDDQSRILTDIRDVKTEAKNIASQYASRVKRLEGELEQKTHKHISGYELRDKLCYLRKNYETKEREYIEVESGKVVYVEPFMPSDHRKQYELKEEFIEAGLGKAKYLGMRFFFDKAYEFATSEEFAEKTMQDVVDEKSHAIMSFCANYLVNEKGVLSITDEVEFDAVFATIQEWFEEFIANGLVEPVKADYPEFEAEPPAEQTQETPAEEKPVDGAEKKPKKVKKKKGESELSEQGAKEFIDDVQGAMDRGDVPRPADGTEGDDDDKQTPWNHL